ncbi:hypothetical protein NBM05_10480 [Rothia sp. AR01]|uniref:Uncharacterized protein n=1 Tax=Rothia santali TaxID=2949643 RepID=A0A9X2KLQ3_9MICC|nr:hypothetical protein [Rothia santali]MCP3426416.1 hypothetical protein [Rothia santali]
MTIQFEPPESRSDQEFKTMAIGMVAGAVPGIVIGLLLSIPWGNPAMWVSIAGAIGIILGLVVSTLVHRSRRKRRRQDA